MRSTCLGLLLFCATVLEGSPSAELHNQGLALLAVGNYRQAEAAFRASLKQPRSASDARRGETLTGLGRSLLFQHQYQEAERTLLEALRLIPASECKAGVQEPLAMLYWAGKQYTKAAHLAEQAVACVSLIAGAEHPAVTPLLVTLAQIHLDAGEAAQAGPLLERAVSILSKEGSADLSGALYFLANVRRVEKRWPEAEKLYLQGIADAEGQEKKHPVLASLLNGLAMLRLEQKKPAEAKQLNEQAIQSGEQLLGKAHLFLAALMSDHAKILRALRKTNEAKSFAARAAVIQTSAEPAGRHVVDVQSLRKKAEPR